MGAPKHDDGGPFHPTYTRPWTPHGGLTLRDWFAGQALAGLAVTGPGDVPYQPNQAAQRAYEWADALLAARAKKAGG